MKNPLREGLDTIDAAAPLVIFIFGVTGDLTRKKLMPALFSLYLNERLSEFRIVGFARREWTQEHFRNQVGEMIAKVGGASEEQRKRFLKSLAYLQSTFEDPAGYEKMHDLAAGFFFDLVWCIVCREIVRCIFYTAHRDRFPPLDHPKGHALIPDIFFRYFKDVR